MWFICWSAECYFDYFGFLTWYSPKYIYPLSYFLRGILLKFQLHWYTHPRDFRDTNLTRNLISCSHPSGYCNFHVRKKPNMWKSGVFLYGIVSNVALVWTGVGITCSLCSLHFWYRKYQWTRAQIRIKDNDNVWDRMQDNQNLWNLRALTFSLNTFFMFPLVNQQYCSVCQLVAFSV